MATQSEIKYNRLMEKAEELFCKLGYKAVSMDEIAAAAGISKMTIYKYFSSKEDLFLKTMQVMAERLYNDLLIRLKNAEGTIAKIDVLLNYSLESSKMYSLALYRDILENKFILDTLIKNKKKMSRTIFQDILREGKEKGEIREEVDIEFMANLLNAMLDGLMDNHSEIFLKDGGIKEFSEKFYDFLKYGLLGK
jgi:AcrR family transcriptional regulator